MQVFPILLGGQSAWVLSSVTTVRAHSCMHACAHTARSGFRDRLDSCWELVDSHDVAASVASSAAGVMAEAEMGAVRVEETVEVVMEEAMEEAVKEAVMAAAEKGEARGVG